MPSRVLREGILTSERVNQLSPLAELFYRRLMSVADDHGRYFAHPALLRSACYPLRVERVKESEVQRWLEECERADLLATYTVGHTKYVQLFDFHQRPRHRSKYPDPVTPLQRGGITTVVRLLADTPPATTTREREERGRREERKERPEVDALFLRFWSAYPKKKSKGQAEITWNQLEPRPDASLVERMVAALDQAKASDDWRREKGRYIPYPSTWLNAKGWEDQHDIDTPEGAAERLKREILHGA